MPFFNPISAMEQYIRSKYERKEFMEGGGNYKVNIAWQPKGFWNRILQASGTGHSNRKSRVALCLATSIN